MIRYLFFLLLFPGFICAQSSSDWEDLIKSAHNIGYCLYNTEEAFCDLHQSRYAELEKGQVEEDGELHYFTMQEDWAQKRVIDWGEQQSLSHQTLVLFFNINQGIEGDFGRIGTRPSGFFIVGIKDDLKFKTTHSFKKQAMSCYIFHSSKPNMLSNIMWREFMSGRLGLIENKVEFVMYNRKNIQRKFKKFKKSFYRYRQHFGD